MKHRNTTIAFLCSFLASSTVLLGKDAAATTWWHRDSGFECFVNTYPTSGQTWSNTLGTTHTGNFLAGLVNGDFAHNAILECPLHESLAEPKTAISTFHVEVMDGSSSASVSAA